jgi:hypothetical protein
LGLVRQDLIERWREIDLPVLFARSPVVNCLSNKGS